MPNLHVIYASTSGHTEYVVEQVLSVWKKEAKGEATAVRAELATLDDLQKGDVLLLASGSWNTGGIEGQLNPYMFTFTKGPANEAKLNGKKTLVIGLGDLRYRYTCAAADHLETYVSSHGGLLVKPSLRIVGEPYDQHEKIESWVKKMIPLLHL